MLEASGSSSSYSSSSGEPRQTLQRRSSRVLQRRLTQVDVDQDEKDEDGWGAKRAQQQSQPQHPPRTLTRSMSRRGLQENHFESDDGFGGQPGNPKSDKQKILLKRQKNKEAAARCRQKKIDTIKNLEKILETQAEERRRLEKVAVTLRANIQTLEVSLATHKPECGMLTSTNVPHIAQLPKQDFAPAPAVNDNVMSTLRVARPASLPLGPPQLQPQPQLPEIIFTPSTSMALENVIHALQETAPDNPFSDFTTPLNNYMSL